MHSAIGYAVRSGRKSVTLVHKGNIMKYTEGAFRDWGYQVAKDFFGAVEIDGGPWCRIPAGKPGAGLVIKDAIADITLQQVLTRPDEFDVIATLNLNGDYLSDALAAQVGGIGIAPGGNINYVTGHAVFEATHGTAPKYADQDKVNPGSVILSGEMMLRHLGLGRGRGSGREGDGRRDRRQARDLRLRAPDGRRDGAEDVGVRGRDHQEHVDDVERKARRDTQKSNISVLRCSAVSAFDRRDRGDTMNRKVTVVGGAGNVGATVARGVADKQLADVVVIDIADQKAAGVALDMLEACPVYGSDARVHGTGDYADSANSDIVVVTSGVPRKPGMSRDDLLNVNYKIMQQVTEQVVKYSPNCIIIPVSNPLDAMAQAVLKLSKFPRERVIGMAGVLDSARMRAFIAKELNVSVENVHAFVLGGHGDTMVPLPRYSTVAGIPITDLMDKATIDRISARTARGGLEITEAGRHQRVVRAGRVGGRDGRGDPARQEEDPAVLGVTCRASTASRDLFVGVPCKLGARGLEEIIQITLTPEEDAAFKKSAAAVKELVDVIGV